MSRSIHRNRRHLKEELEKNYQDPSVKSERAEFIAEQLEKKRKIKRLVRRERLTANLPLSNPVEANALDIQILEQGEHIHYPASMTDIRAILNELPAGTLNGIRSIHLSLGKEEQPQNDEDLEDTDPYTGRTGEHLFECVWLGNLLGTYSNGHISLFATVYDKTKLQPPELLIYLKLLMLSVLVHEVAHHDDFTNRIARGRWRGDDKEKNEIYAERIEHDWTQNIVIPYLRRSYPNETAELDEWFRVHAGVEIPLQLLAPDPRTTAPGGLFKLIDQVSDAFEMLVTDIKEGKDSISAQIHFARNLHYGEHYTKALEILSKILLDNPTNLDALTLKADIYEHQEKYEEAASIATSVVAQDNTHTDAWRVLSYIYVDTKNWQKAYEAITQLKKCDSKFFKYIHSLSLYGRILVMAGRYEELDELLIVLTEHRQKAGAIIAKGLRAISFVYRGEWQLAYDEAVIGLKIASNSYWRHKLLAAKIDAARHLGLATETDEPEPQTLEQLRWWEFDELADRLEGTQQ